MPLKKYVLFWLLCMVGFETYSQYTLRLIVVSVATKPLDNIYVAGNFNNWNAADNAYRLKPFGPSRKAIVLNNIPAGIYELKFTRGSWQTVETNAKGEDITNRTITVNNDTTVYINIEGWKDDYPQKPKPNTASSQVHLEDSAFFIPQLQRYRKIWIYLPKNYDSLKEKRYAVLYMQDGQNLFNEQTAAFGEWGIDEIIDSISLKTGKSCIVVGIENGGEKRMTEYNPYEHTQFGKGEGNLYVDFLVHTLKPYIDKKYKTLPDAAHTYIAGSSMGAVISLYAIIKYPEIFGAAGLFSPAFSITPQLFTDVQHASWRFNRFYFYAGGKESETMEEDTKRMYNLIAAKHNYDIQEVMYPLGKHEESYWRKEFPRFFIWLLK